MLVIFLWRFYLWLFPCFCTCDCCLYSGFVPRVLHW